jgi:hypothetical protein
LQLATGLPSFVSNKISLRMMFHSCHNAILLILSTPLQNKHTLWYDYFHGLHDYDIILKKYATKHTCIEKICNKGFKYLKKYATMHTCIEKICNEGFKYATI